MKLKINTNQVKCWFFEETRNRSTRRKPLGAEKGTNKLNPHMTPDLEIEPGPHWLLNAFEVKIGNQAFDIAASRCR